MPTGLSVTTAAGENDSANCPVERPCFSLNQGAKNTLVISADAGYTFSLSGFAYDMTGGNANSAKLYFTAYTGATPVFSQFWTGDSSSPIAFSPVLSGLTSIKFFHEGQGVTTRLGGITVDVTAPPVPLPAAGFLLLGGFGALAAVKRRKKA